MIKLLSFVILILTPSLNLQAQREINWLRPLLDYDTTNIEARERDVENMYKSFQYYVANPFQKINYKGKEYHFEELSDLIDILLSEYYNNGNVVIDMTEKFQINNRYPIEVQKIIINYYHSKTRDNNEENEIENLLKKIRSGEDKVYLEILFFKSIINKIENYYEFNEYVNAFFESLKKFIEVQNKKNFRKAVKSIYKSQEVNKIKQIYLEPGEFYKICSMASNLFDELNENGMSTFFLLQAASFYGRDSSFKENFDINYNIASKFHNLTQKRGEEKAFLYYSYAYEYAQKNNQKDKMFNADNSNTYLLFNYINKYLKDWQLDVSVNEQLHNKLYNWLNRDTIEEYSRNSYLIFLNIAVLAQHKNDFILAHKYFQLAFIYRTLYSKINDETLQFDLSNLLQISDHIGDTLAIRKYFTISENEWRVLSTPRKINSACEFLKQALSNNNTLYAKYIIKSIEKKLQDTIFSIKDKKAIDASFNDAKLNLYTMLGIQDSLYQLQNWVSNYQNEVDNQIETVYFYEREYELDKYATPLIDSITENRFQLEELTYRISLKDKELQNKNNELIETEKQIKDARKVNTVLTSKISNQTDRIKKDSATIESLNDNKEVILKDIEAYKRTNNDLFLANGALENEKKSLENAKVTLNRILLFLVPFAISLLVISIFLGKSINKKKAENKRLSVLKSELDVVINQQSIEAGRLAKENEENNYKLKLENANSEAKLLSHLAGDHDINKFIKKLPDFLYDVVEGKLPLKNLQKFSENFKKYFNYNMRTRGELTTSINDDIILAEKSAETYLFVNERKVKFSLSKKIESSVDINTPIPKAFITSLVANSVRHGSLGKNEINVTLKMNSEPNGIKVEVEDDGVGLDTLNLEGKNKNTGINLLKQQVANYNNNNLGYYINFTEHNIKNKPNNNGVVATFKIEKKWKEETLS